MRCEGGERDSSHDKVGSDVQDKAFEISNEWPVLHMFQYIFILWSFVVCEKMCGFGIQII